jgi:DNA polymerase-1
MGWNIQLPDAEFYTLDSPELDGVVREVIDQKEVAIDTETDGLVLHKCKPYYWSLSWTSANGLDRRLTMPASTMNAFKRAFDDTEKHWVFANAKFDMHMISNIGIDIKGLLVDVAVMHALLFEEQPHDLKSMARTLLGWKWTDFSDTFGKIKSGICVCGGSKASHFNSNNICKKTGCGFFQQVTPLEVLQKAERENMNLLVDYAANDAFGTWRLKTTLNEMLEKAETWSLYDKQWPHIITMRDYYYRTEMPFTRVLYACERNGLKVNKSYLQEISPDIVKNLSDLRFKINSIAGRMLNPKSKPALQQYFCVEHGIKPLKMTKGGKTGVKKPSVDEKFLEFVADEYVGTPVGECAALISEHEKISKQYGTYIEKMPGRLDFNDRVHMRLNQDVARTGRLSSSDPNMQNITTGKKDRFHIRKAFIPEPGNDMVVADYSQLEMRLLAAASQEPAMMDIFHRNWDIHMGNGSLVFEIPYEDLVTAKSVDKKVKAGELPESAMTDYIWKCLKAREDSKTIGFGLNYGMKSKALARRMGCSVQEAEAKIEQYMDTYPAVRAFFDSSIEEARETGFAFTLMGRRRRLPDIISNNEYDRFRAERQASNMPIQGTAAEVCKMAMINIYEDVELRDRYGYIMCLQVHDEIIGECPKENTKLVKERVREWMEHPFPTDIGVPLTAEIGAAGSWGDAK